MEQYRLLAECLLPAHMLDWFDLKNVRVEKKGDTQVMLNFAMNRNSHVCRQINSRTDDDVCKNSLWLGFVLFCIYSHYYLNSIFPVYEVCLGTGSSVIRRTKRT